MMMRDFCGAIWGDNEENEICSANGFMLLHRQLV